MLSAGKELRIFTVFGLVTITLVTCPVPTKITTTAPSHGCRTTRSRLFNFGLGCCSEKSVSICLVTR